MYRQLRRACRLIALTIAAIAGVPYAAAGEVLVQPFLAWTRNADAGRWPAGGGATVDFTAGRFIVGGDFGFAPGYFDPPNDVSDLIATSQLLTISGHAGVTMPWTERGSRILPYATAGLGVIHQEARDRDGLANVSRNDLSVNFGGGARAVLTRYLAVGGDVRYFRSLEDPYQAPSDLVQDLDRLSFWRISASATLRFGY